MAGTYNKVLIVGRLGKDPDLRYTASGTPVANLSVATNEPYKDSEGNRQNKTDWHKIVVWSKQAESVAQYLGKGSQVLIEGSLQNNKWQDQQGNNRITTEVKAQRVVFMDSGQGAGERPAQDAPSDSEPDPFDSQDDNQNMGPAFPSEASAIDDAPF